MSLHLTVSNLLTNFNLFLASVEPDVMNPQTRQRIQANRAKIRSIGQQILTRGLHDTQQQVESCQKMLERLEAQRDIFQPHEYEHNRRWMVEDLEQSQRDLAQIQALFQQPNSSTQPTQPNLSQLDPASSTQRAQSAQPDQLEHN
jgi:hypothetical protein